MWDKRMDRSIKVSFKTNVACCYISYLVKIVNKFVKICSVGITKSDNYSTIFSQDQSKLFSKLKFKFLKHATALFQFFNIFFV